MLTVLKKCAVQVYFLREGVTGPKKNGFKHAIRPFRHLIKEFKTAGTDKAHCAKISKRCNQFFKRVPSFLRVGTIRFNSSFH